MIFWWLLGTFLSLAILGVVTYVFGHITTLEDVKQKSPLYLVGTITTTFLFSPLFLSYTHLMMVVYGQPLIALPGLTKIFVVFIPPLCAWTGILFIGGGLGRSHNSQRYTQKKAEIKKQKISRSIPLESRRVRRRR